MQIQRFPPGHTEAHAQRVRLHPARTRYQQGGLRQRPEHRYLLPASQMALGEVASASVLSVAPVSLLTDILWG